MLHKSIKVNRHSNNFIPLAPSLVNDFTSCFILTQGYTITIFLHHWKASENLSNNITVGICHYYFILFLILTGLELKILLHWPAQLACNYFKLIAMDGS